MTSSENKGFSVGDIERYHSGKMSPQERHALEKAALDDPFLADALEGYTFTTTPAADLASIQSRLDEEWKKKKPVPFFQKHKWLSVAAVLLIIAGAGWLTFTISDKGKSTPVAAQKTDQQNEHLTSAPPQVDEFSDSSERRNSLADKAQASTEQTSEHQPVSTQNTAQAKSKKAVQERKIELDVVSTAVAKEGALAPVQNNIGRANNQMADARSLDMNRNPASRSGLDANKAADYMSRPQAFLKDSAEKKATVSGRLRGVNGNDTIKNFNVVLQPQPMDSARLVVVGYGTKRKAAEDYPRVIIDTLEPAEGASNFDAYIARNLKMPEELKTKTMSGEVQLSFDVDKDGQAVNITVVKSLCQKCDEEAIRLLKEGPKWKKKKNKKGKITIRF